MHLLVIFKVLVGSLTNLFVNTILPDGHRESVPGPFRRKSFDLARSMSSEQTFSRDLTFLEVKVILILWMV